MHVVMAIGRRRTKAMITGVYVGFEVLVNGLIVMSTLIKEDSGRRGGFKTPLAF